MKEKQAENTSKVEPKGPLKLNRNQKRVAVVVAVGLAGTALLTGCGEVEATNPRIENNPKPTDVLPDPIITVITSTPETTVTIAGSETPIPPTPEQEYKDEFCGINPNNVLFQEGFVANRTVTVSSENGFQSLYGDQYVAEIQSSVTDQVAFEVSELFKDLPAMEGLKRIIVPQTGLGISEVENRAVNLFRNGNPIPNGIQVTEYYDGVELDGGGKMVVAVNAGENGWTTSIWKDAHLVQRPDGGYAISGTLMQGSEDGNGNYKLIPVPGQRLHGGEPDIAIVDGCLPSVVERGPNGEVFAVLKPDVDLSLGSEFVWDVATPEELAAQQEYINETGNSAEIVTIENLDDKIREMPDWRVSTFSSPGLSRVDITDPEGFYKQLITSWAVGEKYQEGWERLGLDMPDDKELAYKTLLDYLSSSYDQYGEPGWVPISNFEYLQSRGGNRPIFDTDPNIVNNGGINLGKVAYVSFCPEDINANNTNGLLLRDIFDTSSSEMGFPRFLFDSSSDQVPWNLYGLFVTDEGNTVFANGSYTRATFDENWSNSSQLCSNGGGIDDARKAQAYVDSFTTFTENWPDYPKYENDYMNMYISISTPPTFPEPYVNVQNTTARFFSNREP
jgi:hypothetical protein